MNADPDHLDSEYEGHPTESSPLLPRADHTGNNTNEGQSTDSSGQPPLQQRRNTSIGPPLHINPTQQRGNKRQDTPLWPVPEGLPPRDDDDEALVIFRRAIGINYTLAAADPVTMEEGRKKAIGMYKAVIDARRAKTWQFRAMWCVVIFCHFAQIIIGAALTALGPLADGHGVIITLLGALNTVIAGVLAMISGQGLPDRIQKDEIGYRKMQDWIEETESLLSVGVIGRNRKEVGLLVEEAFKKYNAAKLNEENNRPTSYVNAPEEPSRASGDGHAVVASAMGSPLPWN
jgi:SMODS and SLOG-associating 2TM effector domain